MTSVLVAVCAEEWPLCCEHLWIVRAVRIMTVCAVLPDRRMFPYERPALLCMASVACVVDTDCPCWGKVEGAGVETFGFGTSSCEENKCSTTFCVDVQPVGQWFIAHPWTYLKTHPMVILSSIGLIVLLAYWPKI